jgi:hypothetical protein
MNLSTDPSTPPANGLNKSQQEFLDLCRELLPYCPKSLNKDLVKDFILGIFDFINKCQEGSDNNSLTIAQQEKLFSKLLERQKGEDLRLLWSETASSRGKATNSA